MRKLSYAALTAAVFFSRAATAHEFVCEETINGEVVHEIKNYPQKLSFTVRVINTHPTDASTALSVRDDLMSSLGVSFTPAAPFTVAAGAAAEFRFEITVHDDAECLALSRVQACATGFEDLFEVTWDSGAAQCAARFVCAHEAGGGGGDHGGGADHGGGGNDHGGGGDHGGGACTCDADCAGHAQCRNGKCEDRGGGGDHGGGSGDHGDDGEHGGGGKQDRGGDHDRGGDEHGGGGKQGGGGDHDRGGDEHGGGAGDRGRGDDHGGHDHSGGGNHDGRDDDRGGERGKGGNR